MQTKLLKATDIAQILGISRSQAYILLRSGEIRGVKFGKSVRVTEEALDEFIQINTTQDTNLDNLFNHHAE